MAETWSQEVARLQQEIAQRESRLHHLVLGDQRVAVRVPIWGVCLNDHARLEVGTTCLLCGAIMVDDC